MATFISTSSSETFHGNSTDDQVIFGGNAAGYRFQLVDGYVQVVDTDLSDGDTGTDTLTGIETLSFADRNFSLSGALFPFQQGETRVTPFAMPNPGITALDDGGYIITWLFNGVHAQRYDANGHAVGSETHIDIATGTSTTSAVTQLADGGYVITWQSDNSGEAGYDVYAKRFDANGNAVGTTTRINTHTPNLQLDPAIAALDDGGYVITWRSNEQDGSNYGIYAQRFNAEGNAVGAETRINTHTPSFQQNPAITALADGGYLISWHSDGQDGSVYGIYAQRFDAEGNTAGPETRINTWTSNHQLNSAITALNGGGYVITWSSLGQDLSNYGIYAQRFDAEGDAVGIETRINTYTTGHQRDSAIAALTGGGYVIAWQSEGQDESGYGIYAQRFDASGAAVGTEARINALGAGNQTAPAVTGLDDGGYIITWHNGLDGGIYAQRFDASGQALDSGLKISGTSADDILNGGAGLQMLMGLKGDDILDGGIGLDTVVGGVGDDRYVLVDFDICVEAAAGGIDTVQSYLSAYTLADNIEHAIIGTTLDSHLNGNALNNTLTGNNGDDDLYGRDGADKLNGGSGNDDLDGGVGADTLQGNAGNDRLLGGGNNDTLHGGANNDGLNGNSGKDELTGGSGADRFIFNSALNVSTNVDTIMDFSVSSGDVIQIDNAVFSSLAAVGALNAANFRANASGNAADADDFILYATDSGRLFYDADGNGAGGKVLFALIGTVTHAALTAADFVVI